MTIIKLYPTREATLLIMASYEQAQITRQRQGLLRQSLSQFCVEAVLQGLKEPAV
jgi:hypothetical protein